MKPVETSIKNQILNGISKEGLGKQKYLLTRRTFAPQDKYNYQVRIYCFLSLSAIFKALSSWDYGWDISEALTSFKPSVHARKVYHLEN